MSVPRKQTYVAFLRGVTCVNKKYKRARSCPKLKADGYAHLYTLGANGQGRRQLTTGKWEVVDAEVSPDKRWFWLHTSEVSPFEQHFYRMPIAGGARERITREVGQHNVTVSPDGRLIADVHSSANRPPELFIGNLTSLATISALTTSRKASLSSTSADA